MGQGVQWVAGTWGVAEDGTHGLPNVRFIDPVVPLKLRGTVGGIRALGPQRVGLFSKRVRRYRGTRTGPVLFPMGHRARGRGDPPDVPLCIALLRRWGVLNVQVTHDCRARYGTAHIGKNINHRERGSLLILSRRRP